MSRGIIAAREQQERRLNALRKHTEADMDNPDRDSRTIEDVLPDDVKQDIDDAREDEDQDGPDEEESDGADD